MSFVETFVRKFRDDLDVGFIVGSGLTCSRGGHPNGVPGCSDIVAEVVKEFSPKRRGGAEELRKLIAEGNTPLAYQKAIAELRIQGNDQLRHKIRSWCRRPYSGDQEHVRSIPSDHRHWTLRPGVAALGELLTNFPKAYSFAVTTNFDPLIEVAVHRAGGIPHSVVFDARLSYAMGIGRVPVLHAHGFWSGETIHSDLELASERPALRALMAAEFESIKAVQVVMGYGGWTDNVMSTLSAGLVTGTATLDLHWCLHETGDLAASKEKEIVEKLSRSGAVNREAIEQRITFHRGVDVDVVLPQLLNEVRTIRKTDVEIEITELRRRQSVDSAHVAQLEQALNTEKQNTQQLRAEVARMQGRLEQKDRDIADVVKEILITFAKEFERHKVILETNGSRLELAIREILQTVHAEGIRRNDLDLRNQDQWSTALASIREMLMAEIRRQTSLDDRHDTRVSAIVGTALQSAANLPQFAALARTVETMAQTTERLLPQIRKETASIGAAQQRLNQRLLLAGKRFRSFAKDHQRTWRRARNASVVFAALILVALVIALRH